MFGGSATLSRNRRTAAVLFYEGRTLFSLDGVRANHLLQRGRLDVTAPLSERLGVGATGELFSRRSYYQDPAQTRREYRYPEFRVYIAWTLGEVPARLTTLLLRFCRCPVTAGAQPVPVSPPSIDHRTRAHG